MQIRSSFMKAWQHEPFDYQLRVAEVLLSDRNVVLVAPTGSGKTLAALHPFVHSRLTGSAWADRTLYALPLRTLTTALAGEYGGDLAGMGLSAAMQTGLNKEDPLFRGHICFATMDQVLSAYVGQPLSTSPGQANLVGGALVGAYFVFDEFHLLEMSRALATMLDLGRRLKGLAPMLVMSATAPDTVTDFLAEHLEAEVITPSPGEIAKMESRGQRQRTYAWCPAPLTAEAVRERHGRGGPRTMVVVNTVNRAQALYAELDRDNPPETEIILLHSRFLPADRAEKERRARDHLSRGSTANIILIATQVVEVGLNVSCHQMLTELSPANSLVQRAGRCARFEGETGEVTIFDLPVDEQGRPMAAPYSALEVSATREVVENRLTAPARSSFAWERAFVEEALGPIAEEAIKALNPSAHAAQVAEALASNPQGAYRRLVRYVPNVNLIISSDPQRLDLRAGVEVFSVGAGVLRSFLSRLDWTGEHAGLVLGPVWNEEAADDNRAPLVSEWQVAENAADALRRAQTDYLIAVSPALASYGDKIGLRLGEPGTWEAGTRQGLVDSSAGARAPADPPPDRGFPETFRRHALEVGRLARDLAAAEARAAIRRLGLRLGLDEERSSDMLLWIETAACLHDLGKLAPAWQSGIWASTAEGGVLSRPPNAAGEGWFLAHSGTFRSPGRGGRLPPHSIPGAVPAFRVLLQLLAHPRLKKAATDVARAHPELGDQAAPSLIVAPLIAAIARHHSSRTSGTSWRTSGAIVLDPLAREEVRALLRVVMGNGDPGGPAPGPGGPVGGPAHAPDPIAAALPLSVDSAQAGKLLTALWEGLVHPANAIAWCLYWVTVRLIRLGDQSSQEALERLAARHSGSFREVLTSESCSHHPPRGGEKQ